MSHPLIEIHSRLRAADRALAQVHGGSTELDHVREATGSLLVALHELLDLWEKRELAVGGLDVEGPFQPVQAPAGKQARRVRR